MDNIKIPGSSWVLVCDGAKALLMQNAGNAANLNLTVVETVTQDNLMDRDLGTDRPGRTHQSEGSGRSAVEETNWHDAAEADFLKGLVDQLSAKAFSKEIEQIVVIASPRALGMMRPHYSTHLKQAITGELAKDLVKHPVAEIEKLLAA